MYNIRKRGVSMIFDCHSDVWTDVTMKRLKGERQVLKNHHIPKFIKGGMEGSIFVIWVDSDFVDTPYERTLQIKQAITDEVAECKEIKIVHNMKEIEQAKKEGKIYIFIGLEGMSSIGSDLSMIDDLYDFGARHAMMTWNEENDLGTGVKGNPDHGLTELGKIAAKKIQDKHMILDVSHLNEKSFWDVMSVAQQPIIASHSNCKALCGASRNLTDEQLKEIKRTNGFVGMNSFNLFVDDDPEKQTADRLVEHMVHVADLIGVEHLAFGFDFTDFLPVEHMASYSDMPDPFIKDLHGITDVPLLLKKMKDKGFTDDEIELISKQNGFRIVREILG